MTTNKIKVKAIRDYSRIKKGDIGYIDGYCIGSDNSVYAIIIVDKIINKILIEFLEVID